MLGKRLIFGFLMAGIAGAVLYIDAYLAPYYPLFAVAVALVGWLAAREFRAMIPAASRPREWFFCLGVLGILLTNFAQAAYARNFETAIDWSTANWQPLFSVYLAMVIEAFVVEMYFFRQPGESTSRVASTALGFVYLGVLPAMFLKIRWLDPEYSKEMLALAIFVPKCGDIGAYFTGRFLGKHPFTPKLSPKKTWEGFFGGLALSVVVAVGVHSVRPIFKGGIAEAALFGMVVGGIGVLGDLAESLIKRDGQTKDASRSIPGFGGLLDVIDSILFAGPVAYLWFMLRN
jgi:phosphatidate cytidylyltransferase